jgi:2-methylisocitrate lyase-like PEP mutase family enzyme
VPAELTVQDRFRALQLPGSPLLLPNPWDVGTAKVLVELGFAALATTSGGFAATLGRKDGGVSRDQALAHGAEIAAAVDVPVTADLENGFADDPAGVAATITAAAAIGLAGGSVEDATRDRAHPVYELGLAVDRVAAAAAAAHAGGSGFVLTARAENYLYGIRDLDDTIARLRAFEAAGADAVYAPGLARIEDVRAVVEAVGVPVNVLLWPGGPGPAELAEAGAARISIGSTFSNVALGALAQAGRQLLAGDTTFFALAGEGRKAAGASFS